MKKIHKEFIPPNSFVFLSTKLNIFNWQELGHQVISIRNVAKTVFSEMGLTLSYKVGTMIEIPRAALVADEVCSSEISCRFLYTLI